MEDVTRAELRIIGKSLRIERERQHLSQEKFAELANIDRTYVSRIEQGAVNVSWDVLSRVLRALHLKPSRLLARAGL